jgi:hypothetical protein
MTCPLCKKPAHVETLAGGWHFSGWCCGYAFLTDKKGRVIEVKETQRQREVSRRRVDVSGASITGP